MVDSLSPHPAADGDTPAALIVDKDRTVVGLSRSIVDMAVTAQRTGRLFQVVTPSYSRLTYPLELTMTDGLGQWVVREPDGTGFRDGLTGETLRYDRARFVSDPDGGTVAPRTDLPPHAGSVALQLETLHQASEGLQLGASTAAAWRALTGSDPMGWGVAEPVSQPWLPRELTSMARRRAPEPTSMVVVGGEPDRLAVGMLTVDRVSTGVLERLRCTGPAAVAVDQQAIEALVDELGGSARSMLLAVHQHRVDGLRDSVPSMPPLPYGLLLGHRVVAASGVDHALAAPAPRVRLAGQGRRQAVWCRLDGGGSRRPFEVLTAVMAHFGIVAAPGY
ncbi:MAG: hypothetical protein GEU83_01255 [Pseudonocardiaceae bacterium]|nr:hypothetical protein [Pseudonocardiaceae bacterium]